MNNLLIEHDRISQLDDFLSLQPEVPCNSRCHHMRTRKIGERLNELGGLALMQAARAHVKRKVEPVLRAPGLLQA